MKEVRQFLGLAGYFRKFVSNFARKVAPLTDLLRKDACWLWGPEHCAAVDEVKQTLCNRPVLTIYDPTLETELHTDASAIGLGAILIQKKGQGKRGRVLL